MLEHGYCAKCIAESRKVLDAAQMLVSGIKVSGGRALGRGKSVIIEAAFQLYDEAQLTRDRNKHVGTAIVAVSTHSGHKTLTAAMAV